MLILGLVSVPNWLLVILGLAVAYLVYQTWHFGVFKKMGVPGPTPYPGLGTFYRVMKDGFMKYDMDNIQKYGKLVGLFETRTPSLLVSDLDILKQVLVKDFHLFTNRRVFGSLDTISDNFLTNLKDDRWRHVRNMMTPAFSGGKLKMMTGRINQCAEQLAENLAQQMKAGNSFDMKEYAGCFTMDVIASTAFGLQLDSQKDKNNPFVVTARKAFDFKLFSPVFIILFFFPFLAPVLRLFKVGLFNTEVLAFFKDIVEQTLDARKDGDKNQVDFLQLMMNAHEDQEGENGQKKDQQNGSVADSKQGLTHTEILAQAILFFLAGYETTANSIAFLSYCLALNPECQDKLKEEIDAVLGDEEHISYDKLHSLEYLEMCIQESLRMYPPALGVDRVASADVTLINGMTVPKDTIIRVPIYPLHMDPDVWAEPKQFIPERFLPEEKASRSPYSYMPFGMGPRVCIAMRLAQIELKVAMVHIVRKYKIVTCDETQIPLTFKPMGLLIAEKGIRLKLEERA